MNRLIAALFATLLSVSCVYTQSGRRVVAKPTPAPTANQDDASGYSESRPEAGRAARIGERFPGLGNGGTSVTTPPAQTAEKTVENEEEVLKVETNLITIPVSVFDRNGLYIGGLRQKDFKIFEDNAEQEIAYFGTTDKPVTVALLLDTSPSTTDRIDEIHRAAEAFVEQLGPQDSVMVIEFNSSVKVQTEATTDRDKIIKAIYRAKYGEGTSLYNAVDEALRKQLAKIEGRKAVVLFTDGVDTTSRKNSYESTLSYAEETDSLIFPIYYNTYMDNFGPGGGIGGINGGIIFGPPAATARGTLSSDYALGRKYLEDLANATGGRVFRPDSTPGGLAAAFEGIAEELRRQYNIGYVPKTEGKAGQRKLIKVRVNRPNLLIRARDSYVVGAAAAKPAPQPTQSPK
jgi:Ca-activated chloride channel family protein